MITISKKDARQFLLNYHGLVKPRSLETDNEILGYLRRVGCIQYDPLNKCGRNADLVLQSRVKNYNEKILYELLYKKRNLIDGWDKNMAVYPVEDWPFFERKRNAFSKRYEKAGEEFSGLRDRIIECLEKKEFISSSDIDDRRIVDWSWAPTNIVRAVLESMYHRGELVIHHKKGTRKYYAPAEKFIPAEIFQRQDPNRHDADYNSWYVLRRIGAVGMLRNKAGDAWLGSGLKKEERDAAFTKLLNDDLITEVSIENADDLFYIKKETEEILRNLSVSDEMLFLAPLDNLLWDRKMIADIFSFDYKWEVYTPVKERKFGYYVLPVIYRDFFAGRIEPVYNRQTRNLHILNWWPEKGFSFKADAMASMKRCLKDFAGFIGAENVELKENQL